MSHEKVGMTPKRTSSLTLRDILFNIVGDLQKWEEEGLEEFVDEGKACMIIAERQLSISRSRQWLQVVKQVGSLKWRERALVADAAIMFATNPNNEQIRDEAVLEMRQLRGRDDSGVLLSSYCEPIDPHKRRSCRHISRLLCSGSLEKNRGSPLYRSFFHSGLSEVHLLRFVSTFLYERVVTSATSHHIEVKEVDKEKDKGEEGSHQEIKDLVTVAHVLFSRKTPHLYSFSVNFNNHLVGFLPLLSQTHPPSKLFIYGPSPSPNSMDHCFPCFDLSCFTKMDISRLKSLIFDFISLPTLSPLSHCDLKRLNQLEFGVPEYS